MVLLVVDTQKLITDDRLYNFSVLKKRIKELIEISRKNGVEVIFVRHDDGVGCDLTKGTEGFGIYDDFNYFQQEFPTSKVGMNCAIFIT